MPTRWLFGFIMAAVVICHRVPLAGQDNECHGT
jgi:hypothetical protein